MPLIRDTNSGSIAYIGDTAFTEYGDPTLAARAAEVYGPWKDVSGAAYRQEIANARARAATLAAAVNKVDNQAVARELARLILGPGGFFLSDGDVDRISSATTDLTIFRLRQLGHLPPA